MTGRHNRSGHGAVSKEAPPDAFGRTAREYELGRPRWPEDLLDLAVAELGLRASAEVLDLGVGTGKLTRSLVRRFGRVIAVEPDEQRAAFAERLRELIPSDREVHRRFRTVAHWTRCV